MHIRRSGNLFERVAKKLADLREREIHNFFPVLSARMRPWIPASDRSERTRRGWREIHVHERGMQLHHQRRFVGSGVVNHESHGIRFPVVPAVEESHPIFPLPFRRMTAEENRRGTMPVRDQDAKTSTPEHPDNLIEKADELAIRDVISASG